MALSFKGDTPLSAPSASATSASDPHILSRNRTLRLTALKKAAIKALASANLSTASEQLQDTEWSLREDVLEIKTNLSQPLISVIFADKARKILDSVLETNSVDKYTIQILPKSNAASSTPDIGVVSKLGEGSPSPFENAFTKLTKTATRLNQISDDLNKQVETIDSTLKSLNLGVSTWAKFSESSDEDGTLYLDEIGYTRLSTRWAIAIRSRVVYLQADDDETIWPFADAPRQLRIKAVGHIPELIEELSSSADAMITKLASKMEEVQAIAEVMSSDSRGSR